MTRETTSQGARSRRTPRPSLRAARRRRRAVLAGLLPRRRRAGLVPLEGCGGRIPRCATARDEKAGGDARLGKARAMVNNHGPPPTSVYHARIAVPSLSRPRAPGAPVNRRARVRICVAFGHFAARLLTRFVLSSHAESSRAFRALGSHLRVG